MWVEARETGENPHRLREKMLTPHIKVQGLKSNQQPFGQRANLN